MLESGILSGNIYLYIFVMAFVTYGIRMLPLTLIRGQIKSRFIKSFLYYVPFVALAAMTFPAVLTSTGSMISAVIGMIAALILAYFGKSLFVVAGSACVVVFIVERFI